MPVDQASDRSDLLTLIAAAARVRPNIEMGFLSHQAFTQPHIRLSSRVKTLNRAYEKLAGLRLGTTTATPFDLEDILGFRFVTLSSATMTDTLSAAIDFITDPTRSLFQSKHCRAVIYNARPDTDPLSIKTALSQLLAKKRRKVKFEFEPRRDTYSAIHLIAKCPVSLERLGIPDESHLISVEIQFRTAMEDVWSQFSHTAKYGQRKSAKLGAVGDHLHALKQLIDGCALYAGLIQVDAERSLATAQEVNEKPISARSVAWGELRDVPDDIAQAYKAAIRSQTLATTIRDNLSETTPSCDLFAEAAAAFAAVENRIREIVTGDAKEAALYKVRMERAFCLLYSEKVQALEEAFAIYEVLHRSNSTDAIVRLRFGQTLKRRNDLKGAKESLESAKALLESGEDTRVQDRDKILRSVHMELGSVCYDLSQVATDAAARRELNNQSLAAAQAWLRCADEADPADRLGAINNILYFAWEELRQFKTCTLTDEQLRAFLVQLDTDQIANLVAKPKHDAIYDTITRLYEHLGDREGQSRTAAKTIDAIYAKLERRAGKEADKLTWVEIGKNLTADEMDTYQHAMRIISRPKGGTGATGPTGPGPTGATGT